MSTNMLESAVVQVSLADFERLREESQQLRVLKKQIGSCCNIDWSKFDKSKSNQDIEIKVNSNKLADVIKKCGSFDVSVDARKDGESPAKKEAELLYAKVLYR